MNTTRISRRNLIVIGAAFPLSTLVVRSAVARAAAHNGKDHGNATPGASPEASPATNTGTGAAYLTIQNNGSEADRLVSAKSDAAQIVEIHEAKVDNGVMSMKELADGLEIPAGESVSFAPSDLHLMLINLNHSLARLHLRPDTDLRACRRGDDPGCRADGVPGRQGTCHRRQPHDRGRMVATGSTHLRWRRQSWARHARQRHTRSNSLPLMRLRGGMRHQSRLTQE